MSSRDRSSVACAIVHLNCLQSTARTSDDSGPSAVGAPGDFVHIEKFLLLINALPSDADAAQSAIDAEALVGCRCRSGSSESGAAVPVDPDIAATRLPLPRVGMEDDEAARAALRLVRCSSCVSMLMLACRGLLSPGLRACSGASDGR